MTLPVCLKNFSASVDDGGNKSAKASKRIKPSSTVLGGALVATSLAVTVGLGNSIVNEYFERSAANATKSVPAAQTSDYSNPPSGTFIQAIDEMQKPVVNPITAEGEMKKAQNALVRHLRA